MSHVCFPSGVWGSHKSHAGNCSTTDKGHRRPPVGSGQSLPPTQRAKLLVFGALWAPGSWAGAAPEQAATGREDARLGPARPRAGCRRSCFPTPRRQASSARPRSR